MKFENKEKFFKQHFTYYYWYLLFTINSQLYSSSIYLSSVWSNLSEDIIVDSESFTDLSPQQSNDWSITVKNLCEKCDFQLSELLTKFIEELRRTIGVAQLVGGSASANTSLASNMNQMECGSNEELKRASLSKLTGGKSRLNQVYSLSSNMMEKATSHMQLLNVNDALLPLDKDFLDFIMSYLFPDANLASKANKSSNSQETVHLLGSDSFAAFAKKLNLMKASSIDNTGLLNKLATCVSLVNLLGQTRAIAQLWREFLLEIRFRFDSTILISGLDSSREKTTSSNSSSSSSFNMPDLSRCLLHQKIQMLNCCIRKRLERQELELSNSKSGSGGAADEDEEDEFYDCDEDESEKAFNENSKPEGRLKRFSDLFLLKKPNEPLYVPITQVNQDFSFMLQWNY